MAADEPPIATSLKDGVTGDQHLTVSPAEEGASREAVITATRPESPFDRELDQYRLAAEELAVQEQGLRAKLDECRDGGDLLVDYRQYDSQLRRIQAWQRNLAVSRGRYIADRDRLAAWGSTEDWVVAGSIVTVRYLDGSRDTFVLTERHADTEYETVSYSSPMGQAVRKRRVGDKVSLPAGAPLVIDSIIPGFRMTVSRADGLQEADPPAPLAPRRTVPTAATSGEALAGQLCRDKAYRDDLFGRRYAPSVRLINEYVDELRSRRHVSIPYVAPTYGGIDARLLTLMQDPGPKTDLANADGSGMICLENVDLSAARQKFFLDEAGIRISEIVSWNAYPWPKPHPQTGRSDREAAEALRGFLMLIPGLEVVILNGAVAKRVWRVLEEIDPACVAGISSYPTFHTSERAVNPTQRSVEYIANVHGDLSSKYAAAAHRLRSTGAHRRSSE
ncbi:GreA/GreB family elongation factor [Prescottella subtropica]|uniref:GreA/GreB family elongation factor n=1 Tax=Prescottella subtropica TaxID=2545757 RepID=UPI001F4F6CE1|nr:GreA/GreB family elongation factor [Prescottella subtropica]